MKLRILPLLTCLAMILVCSACRPDYPKCNNDEDCSKSDKGMAEGRLMCVNGLCQQCRADSDCAGLGMQCNAGLCERIIGFCTSDDNCLNGQKCKNNVCSSECLADTDCNDGKGCQGGRCVDKVECTLKSDCQNGLDCVRGKCIDSSAGSACDLPTIYFAFNSSTLDDDFQNSISNAASCIKQKHLRIRIAGYTDERGTEEYNMALGERRARSVYNYLVQMGVDPSDLSTISYGKEDPVTYCGMNGSEACYQKNRRVIFEIR